LAGAKERVTKGINAKIIDYFTIGITKLPVIPIAFSGLKIGSLTGEYMTVKL
jgi:hypothetical protein